MCTSAIAQQSMRLAQRSSRAKRPRSARRAQNQHTGENASDSPSNLTSCLRRGSRRAGYRFTRQRPVAIRLETVQGPAYRGQLPAFPTRRRGEGASEGLHGTHRRHRGLRTNPRTAAAPQGRAGDGNRPSQFRRVAGCHARAKAADRKSQMDGGSAALYRGSHAHRLRFQPGRLQQAVDGCGNSRRRPHQRPAAEPGFVHHLLQQAIVERERLQRVRRRPSTK